jgi:hypothetical protein
MWTTKNLLSASTQTLENASVRYQACDVFVIGSGRASGAKVSQELAVYEAIAVKRGNDVAFLHRGQLFHKRPDKPQAGAAHIVLGFVVTPDKVTLAVQLFSVWSLPLSVCVVAAPRRGADGVRHFPL